MQDRNIGMRKRQRMEWKQDRNIGMRKRQRMQWAQDRKIGMRNRKSQGINVRGREGDKEWNDTVYKIENLT